MDIIILMLGGTLAGIANFFVKYVELPLDLSRLRLSGYTFLDEEYKPPLTCKLALIGYIFLGIVGSLLTFLLIELDVLKDIDLENNRRNGLLVFLGYGIVFGYSAVKVLQNTLTIVIPTRKSNVSKIKK